MNVKRLVIRIVLVILIAGSYAAYLKWKTRPGMREVMRVYDDQRNLRARRFLRYGNHGQFALHYTPEGELVNGPCSGFLYQANIALEGTCRDGRWEGPVRGYDPHGRLAMEGTYTDGMKHGTFKFYRDGRLNRVQVFEMGRLSGRQEDYYPDGQVHCTGIYRRHRRDGEYRCYYPDGKPKLEDHFRDGRRHGLHRRWDADGRLVWEMPFENGRETRHHKSYRVRSVINGDTILLDNDRKVRLRGIREIPDTTPDGKSQPREVLKELLRRGSRYAEVRLEFARPPQAQEEWEAYVFIDTGETLDSLKKRENFRAPADEYYDFFPVRFSHFINASLILKGVARTEELPPEDRYSALLRKLEVR